MSNRSRRRTSKRREAKKAGYRSGFEQQIAEDLEKAGVDFEYEPRDKKVEFHREPSKYLPDFVLPNGIIIEAKGNWTPVDRKKHLLIREQHPELDIRFVFQLDNKLARNSTTRYSEWCEKHGFKYAIGGIPSEWLEE